MKKLLTLTLIFLGLLSGPVLAEEIDALVAFDTAKLKSEEKDGCVLFRYEGTDVNYVEHGDGAPLLPCRHVYVVAPKGATYKGCRTKITREQLPNNKKIYVRNPSGELSKSAKCFPPQCVEFVKELDEDGFRLFLFRVYPVICQPADGTVMRVLGLQLQIKCEGDDRYENVPVENVKKIKNKVLNPRSLETLVASLTQKNQEKPAESFFATERQKKTRALYQNRNRNDELPEFLETINDNVSISDGSVLFTPIKF